MRRRFAGAVPPAIALLIAVASLGGILDARMYARETPNWAAQGIGQDWFDLLVLAPSLVIAWAWARRDPRRGSLVLGGALVCTVYTFTIYTFSIHFNALFLIYCAVFGLACFALAGLGAALVVEPPAADDAPVRERAAGGFLIGMGVLFAVLWLADIVPAIATHQAPPSLIVDGLPTNPIHVLDLSLVLPSFVLAGVALVRGRPRGRAAGTILASFSVLMALSIAALVVVLRVRGEPAELTVAGAMVGVAIASAVVLVHLLRAPAQRCAWTKPRSRSVVVTMPTSLP